MTVIVDGPPALAATETLALAGLVERNLVVARWGKTSRREVELAVRRLQEWNLDEILLVLNMVDVRRGRPGLRSSRTSPARGVRLSMPRLPRTGARARRG